MQQSLLFDHEGGKEAKKQGMERAAMNRAELLRLAREAAVMIGRARSKVNADEVQHWMIDHIPGYVPRDLGPAAGSIFKGDHWVFTGEWVESRRVSNHCRMLRVWRLIA